MTTLDFWYEFASTYSYPAAMRIGKAAAAKGVEVRWKPFLLGPIFGRQGWTTSPFNLYPAKGANMFRDLERICAKEKIPFTRPDPFPQNSLLAARIATALPDDQRPVFSRAVYTLEFGQGQSIEHAETLAGVLGSIGIDAAATLARATSPEIKEQLKKASIAAEHLGLYGAPSFVTPKGELFWGNDRLEDALAWAVSESVGAGASRT